MKLYRATGRRKTSRAQVILRPGSGVIRVNNKELDDFFPVVFNRTKVRKPLAVTDLENAYNIDVIVRGGGTTGQTDAIQLGIARALIEVNEEYKSDLRDAGLLTRDPRMVERKKYGQKKARKKFQFSKR